jgi:GntR family transcriptional regulator/MocR family aminotransferase
VASNDICASGLVKYEKIHYYTSPFHQIKWGIDPMQDELVKLGARIVTLDHQSPVPLFRQIYYCLRDGIVAGELKPGEQLPSSRLLALELGVSRLTIQNAYEQLITEGYAEGRHGSGTYVAHLMPPLAGGPIQDTLRQPAPAGRRLARRVREWQALPLAHQPPTGEVAFRTDLPAIDAFPTELWGRLLGRRWRQSHVVLLTDQQEAGYGPLCQALADYLMTIRGLRCTAEQILIVADAQQAIDLAARILLDPNDKAWLEDPGRPAVRGALIGAGAQPCPVPVDDEGLNVAAGMALYGDARLAIVTPAHHWPTGATMTLPRRLALLEWAYRAGAWLVEDDHGGLLASTAAVPSSLQALDQQERVLHIGALGTILFPALRMGYLVAPPDLIDPLLRARRMASGPPPLLEQAVLADFIANGHFAHHVRHLTSLYAERQAALLAACAHELSDQLAVASASAGFHLTGWLAPGEDDRQVAARAAAAGITVTPISAYRLTPGGRPGVALGYGALPAASIGPAVQRLARALRGQEANMSP